MSIFSPLLFPLVEPGTGTGLFALRPLFIAGMTRPVVEGDGGINIAVLSDYPDGVLCVIDPYMGMEVGDQHDIFWGLQKIWHKEVLPEELNKRLFFYLPTKDIVSGWVETVHYQLTRKGSTTPDDPSVPLRLLVKLDEPGGDDKFPHLPGHSELKPVGMPEDVRLNGVTAEWAEKGVPLTVPKYTGIRVRDVIYVYWGSVRLPPHVVTQAQADGIDPVIVDANQEAILAGGDSAALLVEYEVRDEVWNWSQKRSLSTRVLVDAGAWRLEQPIIKESINGVIDLIKLGKANVTVQIHVRTDDFDIGDTVVMTWIGTPVHGESLIHRSKPTRIDNIPSILDLMVPNAAVRAIAMGKADASYVLTKTDGSPPLSSKRTFANVVGEISQLPAPTIREVIGDTLEPTEGMATVDIGPSPLIKGGDLIDLVWLGTKSDNQPYLHEIPHLVSDGEAGKAITLYVEAEHIKVLENGKLNLFYRVSNDKSALYGVSESEHTFINVEAVRAELLAPKVVEAPDNFLDPAWVPGSATLRIGYLGTAAGDVLTYYWNGPTAAGSTSDWIPITTIIAGKPVDFRINEQFITRNLNQQVEVRYTLLRAATGKHSYSAVLELYVGKEVKPSIDKVTDSQLRDIVNRGTTVDTTVILTGKATPNLKVIITDNDALPQTVEVGPDGIWTSTRTGLTLTAHNFVAKAAYGSGVESPAWGVNVVAEVQPSIDKVTDSQLRDIANRGTTVDTTVILTGKATPNLKVAITDNGALPQTVDVKPDGSWTLTRTGLSRTGHSFVAKSESLASAAWVVNVVAEVQPSIDKVTDSQLRDIANRGTTVDTTVILTGKATPNLKVVITDNGALPQTVDVKPDGSWTLTRTGLSRTGHSFVAKSESLASAAWVVNVVAEVQPSIDKITDSQLRDIANRGTTVDTTVILTGKATPNLKVVITDNGALPQTVDVKPDGSWTLTRTGLSRTGHSFVAKSESLASAAWVVNVVAEVQPSIDKITDSQLRDIANRGTTVDTTVILTGKATPNLKVVITDNGALPQTVDVKPDGSWTLTRTGLSRTGHSFVAKSESLSSAAWTLTVVALVTPSVTVRDPQGANIPHGGETTATTVYVSGSASINTAVEVRDNGVRKQDASVNGSGGWGEISLSVGAGFHSITARGLYGNNPVSPARSFTVVVDTWRDSITDFNNGTAGNWQKGPAGFQGRITGGVFHNDTTAVSGHAGVLFSQTFNFMTGRTYSFSYSVRNFSPLVNNVPPIFSVSTAAGQQILPAYSVPRTGQWFQQSANFSVTLTGNQLVRIVSHQDRGGNDGSDGGNDYQIDNIIVRRVS